MQTTIVTKPAFQLLGIETRTNNATEMNPATAKIGKTVQQYFETNPIAHITGRLTPGVTYCAYADYQSDYTGDYTYLIGELVETGTKATNGLAIRTVPAQTYCCLTTEPGPMPMVCIQVWQHIWQMTSADLGGNRSYNTDFEIYDDRATNPQHTVLDIYIGIHAVNIG